MSVQILQVAGPVLKATQHAASKCRLSRHSVTTPVQSRLQYPTLQTSILQHSYRVHCLTSPCELLPRTLPTLLCRLRLLVLPVLRLVNTPSCVLNGLCLTACMQCRQSSKTKLCAEQLVPDSVFAVQVKQQEWCQQEQSLKSIEQALNQFQVQENKLQRTVSELQALQQTTAQRVSSLLHQAYKSLLTPILSCTGRLCSTQQHSG